MPQYFAFTGNFFVDVGVFILSELVGKKAEEIVPEDLKEPLDTILFLYLTDIWRKQKDIHRVVCVSGRGRGYCYISHYLKGGEADD